MREDPSSIGSEMEGGENFVRVEHVVRSRAYNFTLTLYVTPSKQHPAQKANTDSNLSFSLFPEESGKKRPAPSSAKSDRKKPKKEGVSLGFQPVAAFQPSMNNKNDYDAREKKRQAVSDPAAAFMNPNTSGRGTRDLLEVARREKREERRRRKEEEKKERKREKKERKEKEKKRRKEKEGEDDGDT